jgi:glycosyltransferase involved in cell wall biosynthesis
MKALVISPQPFFTPRGTPFSVYYRTMISAELGIDIDLLTYGEGQDVDIPGVRILRIPRFAFLGNVKTGPSALKFFLDIFVLIRAIWLLIRNRYDVVHAHEEAVFFCPFLKPIFGFKLIYDMHSSLPQQLTNFNFTKSKSLIGLFTKLEDTAIRNSEAVITICPDLADYVDSLIGKQDKHFLIENSIFDDVKLAEKPGGSTADQEQVDSHPVPGGNPLVVYTGTLEPYQGIDLLIGGFAQALQQLPDAALLIAGGNPDQVTHFRKMADAAGLGERCVLTGRVPQRQAKYFNSVADIIVSPRQSGTNTPLKVYEQLQSGIPLVATDIYSHTQVLSSDVAFLVPPTTDGIAAGLIDAAGDQDAARRRVQNAQQLYKDQYSRTAYIDKMTRLFDLVRTS